MSYSDHQLRALIDAIFNQYDTDRSFTLDRKQVTNLINTVFAETGENRRVTDQEVNVFIQSIDRNSDGKISKPQLFQIFKQILN